ncbi:MAG: calcium-binding protein, partial [Caulobacterales bacterium]
MYKDAANGKGLTVAVDFSWAPGFASGAFAVNSFVGSDGKKWLQIRFDLNKLQDAALLLTAPPSGMVQLDLPGRFKWDGSNINTKSPERLVSWGANYLERIGSFSPVLRSLVDPSSPQFDRNVAVAVDAQGRPHGYFRYRPLFLEEIFADEFSDALQILKFGSGKPGVIGPYGRSFGERALNWSSFELWGASIAGEFGLARAAGLGTAGGVAYAYERSGFNGRGDGLSPLLDGITLANSPSLRQWESSLKNFGVPTLQQADRFSGIVGSRRPFLRDPIAEATRRFGLGADFFTGDFSETDRTLNPFALFEAGAFTFDPVSGEMRATEAAAQPVGQPLHRVPVAEMALMFGSTLGRQLAGKNLFVSTLVGSVMGTVAYNVGQSVDAARGAAVTMADGSSWVKDKSGSVWRDFGGELATFTTNAAIGSMSSWLSLEMGRALGLKGFGAELLNVASSTLIQHTLTNLAAGQPIFKNVSIGSDVLLSSPATGPASSALLSAYASFFGAKLGAMVVRPETQTGVVLSSLGAAAGGSYMFGIGRVTQAIVNSSVRILTQLGANFGAIANISSFLLPGVGTFIGFVLGALIGNLFGRRKPRVPTANAETVLQLPFAQYEVGAVTQSNGGNEFLVRDMATAARDTLNGLIETVARRAPGEGLRLVSNVTSPTQKYGHTGGQLWVEYDANLNGSVNSTINTGSNGGERFNVNSGDEAVDRGVLFAMPRTQIIGGDLFLKRALFNLASSDPTRPKAPNLAALSGDLQIAEDYRFYLQNRSIIDAMIAEPYTSMKLATVDFLRWVRETNRLNAYVAAYPGDPSAKNLAQVRAWGKTQWDALSATQRNSELTARPFLNIAANIDTAFYDANKAFMTRALAKDSVALTGADVTFYNANRAQVDRIASRIAVTQMAAGWIITLQRAAELQLNRASVADFYGGPRGFIDSLNVTIANAPIDYELVTFLRNGNDLQVRFGAVGTRPDANLVVDATAPATSLVPHWDARGAWNGTGDAYRTSVQTIDGGSALVISKSRAGTYTDANGVYAGSMVLRGGDYAEGWYRVNPGQRVGYRLQARSLDGSAGASHLRVGVFFFSNTGVGLGHQILSVTDIRNGWATITGVTDAPATAAYMTVEMWSVRSDGNANVAHNVALRNVQLHRLAPGAAVPAFAESGYQQFTVPNWDADTNFVTSSSELARNNYFDSRINGAAITYADTGGDDIYSFTPSDDTAQGSAGHNWFDGNAGNDTLDGAGGNDVLLGRAGADLLRGGTGDDFIAGGDNDDNWFDNVRGNGRAGLRGGDGNDTLVGGAGMDTHFGEFGDDTLVVEEESVVNWYDGFGENTSTAFANESDTLSFERFRTAVNFTLSDANSVQNNGAYAFSTHTASNYNINVRQIENIRGSAQNDTLTGNAQANVIEGGAGNDTLNGGAGNDTLEGGIGADSLVGGAGIDSASYRTSASAIFIDRTGIGTNGPTSFGGDAEGDTFNGVENLIGSQFADTLRGDASANRLSGGRGDDWFEHSAGNDTMDGGDGFDTVDYAYATAAVTVRFDTNVGGGAAAGHAYVNIEHARGSDFADTLTGSGRDETFTGAKGNDTISGGGGIDT